MRELEEPAIIRIHEYIELPRIPDMHVVIAYYEESSNKEKEDYENRKFHGAAVRLEAPHSCWTAYPVIEPMLPNKLAHHE
jgi:hypothetical protein